MARGMTRLLTAAMAIVALWLLGGCSSDDQQQQVMDEENPEYEYLSVCTRAEDQQQEAPNAALNGKIVFTSQIYGSSSSSANVSAGASASGRASSDAPVTWRTDNELCVINADGTGLTRLTDTPEAEGSPQWLPDGKRIAFVTSSDIEDNDVFVMNADGSNRKEVPWFGHPQPESVAWSPDGEMIAFESSCDIYIRTADGSGNSRNLTSNSRGQCRPSSPTWSPDGKKIAFSSGEPGGIYVTDVSREGETSKWRQLTNDSASDSEPSWSPDGTEIAFVRYESRADIYKIDVDTLEETRLTDDPGGNYPTWSPDGEKIAFIREDGLYVMNADGSDPTPIFETDMEVNVGSPDWQPQRRSGLRCMVPLLRLWC